MEDLVEQHHLLGHAVTEIISEYVESLDSRRVASEATPADLERLFNEDLPENGAPIEDILERFKHDILPHAMNVPSPRYFGQFNPAPLPIGVWADALSSALNQNAGAWRNGPTSAIIEARVIRWLCQLLGYNNEAFGTLASGGSEANLLALKCARDRTHDNLAYKGVRAAPKGLIIYASEQCHYSIEKSADILGLGRESVRKIPTDEKFHIRLRELSQAIERDKLAGWLPCCVVGVAGTTSTGVIDPLKDVAAIARENNCWFHVDAAYGGALAFSEKYRPLLDGIEEADSVTIDPHKWMFVPFACGAVLVRGGAQILRDAFDITPEYLNEDRGGTDVAFDFFRYGQMGSRRFNSLKLWMCMKFMGVRGYAETVERQIELTKYLAAQLDDSGDFKRVGGVETAVCCFKFLPDNLVNASGLEQDRVQQQLQQQIERGGEAWITTTVVNGRRVLRVNINSFLTERRHIDDLIELLRRESSRVV